MAHCVQCWKVWIRPKACDRFDSLCSEWLDLQVPSGWMYPLREMGSIDFVGRLALCEALLWNSEPCEGLPQSNQVATVENAIYRLTVVDLLDSKRGCLKAPDRVSSALEPWGMSSWAPMIAIDLCRNKVGTAPVAPREVLSRLWRRLQPA